MIISSKSSQFSIVTIAVTRQFKNADGEYETDFLPIVLWGAVSETTLEYCKKGDIIGIRGRAQSEDGKIVQARNCGWGPAANRVKFYNCFKSEKQAEAEAEKILVRRQLEDIARRLNKGQEIDWNDNNQLKYCIGFDFPFNVINIGALYRKLQGSVYCLSDEFKDVAIQEIGEERLKKYFKGE